MCWCRMCSLNNVRTTAHILHIAHSMSAASLVLYCKFVVNFILFFRRGGSLTRQTSTSVAKTSWAWIVDASASILHCWITSLHIQSNAFSTLGEWGYISLDMCYWNWILFDSFKLGNMTLWTDGMRYVTLEKHGVRYVTCETAGMQHVTF